MLALDENAEANKSIGNLTDLAPRARKELTMQIGDKGESER